MADYLEAYAKHFELPVRTGVKVNRLSRDGTRYIVDAGGPPHRGRSRRGRDGDVPGAPRAGVRAGARSRHRAAAFERVPESAASSVPGDVLIVGAGNSGADIAHRRRTVAPHVAVGAASGTRAVPHREPHRPRHSAVPLSRRLSSDPHGGHADGTAGPPDRHFEGRPADSREAGGPRRRRRRTHAAGRRAFATASRFSPTAASSTSRT